MSPPAPEEAGVDLPVERGNNLRRYTARRAQTKKLTGLVGRHGFSDRVDSRQCGLGRDADPFMLHLYAALEGPNWS